MPGLKTETFGSGDQSWLASTHGMNDAQTEAPDPALFTLAAYPNGVPSGTPVGKVTATGKVGPYTGDSSEEVQTLTEGGSGLTSFTITFDGDTTASLDDDATAAQVQDALEDLDSIGAGNVEVTGGPLASGAFSVKFVGDLANKNVAAMTTTPTGGTGTVVVATSTAGGADVGADGREVLYGFLLTDQKAPGEGGWPVLCDCHVLVQKLPVENFLATGHNASGKFVLIDRSDS